MLKPNQVIVGRRQIEDYAWPMLLKLTSEKECIASARGRNIEKLVTLAEMFQEVGAYISERKSDSNQSNGAPTLCITIKISTRKTSPKA